MQLAVQISNLSINGSFIHSTIPDFTTPSPQKPRVVVVINTLWILSLLIALITASLGILVKQWFHELLSYETHDPMERLKLRFFREAGVERWKVFTIASALPLLLQLAFLLFFIGLALFFHQLDPVVAWFTTGTGILWLGSLLFATLAPTFSSQCTYKTPFLKGVISQIRLTLILLPRNVSFWLWDNTPERWFPKLKHWFDELDDQFRDWKEAWGAFEEGSVCKDDSLSIPVISCSKDLLQGERLRDSIGECIQDISERDLSGILEEMRMDKGSRRNRLLPDVPYSSAEVVGSFALDAAQDDHLRSIYFGQEAHSSLFAILYFGCSLSQSGACAPGYSVISESSCSAFIHLIKANPSSAAFSFLTMYSIRYRTLIDHPDPFCDLLRWLSESEKHSNGVGESPTSSQCPLQLIKTRPGRGRIPIKPTLSNKMSHPLHLEATVR